MTSSLAREKIRITAMLLEAFIALVERGEEGER